MELDEDPTCLWVALGFDAHTYVVNVKPEQGLIEFVGPAGNVVYTQPLAEGWDVAFKAHLIRLISCMGLIKLQPVAANSEPYST